MEIHVGLISGIKDNCVMVVVPMENIRMIDKQNITSCEVMFSDGRTISPEQRKKVYALMGEISDWSGHMPEFIKERMKYSFIEATGNEYFSLSDCSVDTARQFINFLIDFCFYHNIPTKDSLLGMTEDISHYLYACLATRKCAICNDRAEIHHCEGSRVGMGFNRNRIDNLGRRAIALCKKHHAQAHIHEREFFDKYHVYGVKLDNYLLKKLKL